MIKVSTILSKLTKILFIPLEAAKRSLARVLMGPYYLLRYIPGYRKLPLYLQKGLAVALSLTITITSSLSLFLFEKQKETKAAWPLARRASGSLSRTAPRANGPEGLMIIGVIEKQ